MPTCRLASGKFPPTVISRRFGFVVMMPRPLTLVVLMGSVLVSGLGLSVWSNQSLLGEMSSNSMTLKTDESVTVLVLMEAGKGVYAVDMSDYDGMARAMVYGPSGNPLVDESIPRDVYEGYFEADIPGEYVLVVQNDGAQKTVTALVGPEPDTGKRSMLFISTYVVVVGLGGMAVSVIYAIRKR